MTFNFTGHWPWLFQDELQKSAFTSSSTVASATACMLFNPALKRALALAAYMPEKQLNEKVPTKTNTDYPEISWLVHLDAGPHQTLR